MKRYATAALLVGTLLLAGCSASDSFPGSTDSTESQSYIDQESTPNDTASESDNANGSDNASETESAPGAGVVVAPSVVTTGDARVRHDDPYAISRDFINDAEARGGHVSDMEVEASAETPRAEVTVKLPADQYQDFVDKLGDYGDVVTVNTTSDDVTSEHVDLRARADALQASVDRLSGLMDEAGSVDDLLDAEQTLTDRQSELDSVNGQLSSLENRIAMSTLTVVFSTVASDSSTTTSSSSTHNPFSGAWDALLSSVEALLIITLGLLPWALALALIAWITWRIVRRNNGRGEKPER